MKILNWNNIRLLFMLTAVVVLYSFGLERNKKRQITDIQVDFVDENGLFITEESVSNLLKKNLGTQKKIIKYDLFLKPLESELKNHPMIETAEVSVTTSGKLRAQVKQKTPIARVYDKNTSYYMDYYGTKMPLSENFSARVPIVSGSLNDQNKKEITELLRFIYDDSFLKKNIIAVTIKENNNVFMRNRNYNYIIDFGKIEQIQQKFNNYKSFFQKAPKDPMIDKYKSINLNFKKLVVCTK